MNVRVIRVQSNVKAERTIDIICASCGAGYRIPVPPNNIQLPTPPGWRTMHDKNYLRYKLTPVFADLDELLGEFFICDKC